MGFLSSIFHRDKADVACMKGYIDHHSHLLPGVDDGFKTIDDSLKCLDVYAQWGFEEVWLTPHIMEDYPNRTEDLKKRFEELTTAYKGGIKLHLASENMIDSLFVERLENMDLLPMDDRLLVETSYFSAPANFHDVLDEIMHKGLRPLLAHPERYRYMSDKDYDGLLEKGIELQLNIFSLLGMYGKSAKEKAVTLLKRGAYKISGTDVHNLRQPGALIDLSKNSSVCRDLVNLKYT